MRAASCLALGLILAPACAGASGSAGTLLDDARSILGAPARWTDADWRQAGWLAGATLGTALLIDRPLRDGMARQSGDSVLMRRIEPFGAEYSLAVLGGFYLAGQVGEDRRMQAVARDGLSASLIASGLITPALKLAFGRSRPSQSADTFDFRPFSSAQSFPSGHTTQAFAVASVIAAHYPDQPLVQVSAWGVAGLVGLARSYHEAHYASDIVAGALIGSLVGQAVVARHAAEGRHNALLLPVLAPGSAGVQLVQRF